MLRCAGHDTFPIVGTGTLRIYLGLEERVVCVTLMDVAYVPGLSRHFLSLRRIANAGNKYIGTRVVIRIVFVKSGDELFAPAYGHLNGTFGYRTDAFCKEKDMPWLPWGRRQPRKPPLTSTISIVPTVICMRTLCTRRGRRLERSSRDSWRPVKGARRRKGSGSPSSRSPTNEQLSQLSGVMLI